MSEGSGLIMIMQIILIIIYGAIPSGRSKDRLGSGRIEQALADELALGDAARAGEEAAAGMGRVLVQGVHLRHRLEDLDEAGARVALVGDEEEAGVELDRLAPGRPALGGEVAAVIVGIAAAE